jgi:cytohesin
MAAAGRARPADPPQTRPRTKPPTTIADLPDTLLHKILAVHPEVCFPCSVLGRHLRRVSLEVAGTLAGERWALRLAAKGGHVAALLALLDGGADMAADLGDTSATPPLPAGTALHWAARRGRAAAVQLLLGAGSAVDTITKSGWTALHWAAEEGHAEVVQLLLGAGSAVNAVDADGWTALHCAVAQGHAEAAQLLLGARSVANAAAKDGRTAMHWAAMRGNAVMVQALLRAGTGNGTHLFSFEKDGHGWNALDHAVEHAHVEVAGRLLAAGCPVYAAGADGRTALHRAAHQGRAELVQLLLAARSKVHAIDIAG